MLEVLLDGRHCPKPYLTHIFEIEVMKMVCIYSSFPAPKLIFLSSNLS